MPSVWFWTTLVDLLTYGPSLVSAASSYCGAHGASSSGVVVQVLDLLHVKLGCVA
jgi:hypothetical protein